MLHRITVLSICVCALLLSACGAGDDASSEQTLNALRTLPVSERVPRLLELEREAPDDAAVALELGIAYGTAEQYAIAEQYFRRALEGARRDIETRQDAAVGLANSLLARGQFSDAIEVTREHGDGDGSEALILVRARSAYFLDDLDLAGESYAAIWDSAGIGFLPIDFLQYADYFLAVEDGESAETILVDVFNRSGYVTGLGFRLSSALEVAGRLDESILYAFIDSYQALFVGDLAEATLEGNLATMGDELDLDAAAATALEFTRHMVAERWPEALELADNLSFSPITGVLLDIAALHARPDDEEAATRVTTAILGPFASFAPMYPPLISSLRTREEYRFSSASGVLERAILVSPLGPTGDLARRELVEVLGLPAEAATIILSPQEIQALMQAAVAGAALDDSLGRVLASLTLPEHPYTGDAMRLLSAALAIERVREYVETWVSSAPETARLRIEPLL